MNGRIRDMESSQRPRERLLTDGESSLSDAELVALLLRTGRRGRSAVAEAHDLLSAVGGLAGLARLSPPELMRRPGFGPAKAATLTAALELGRRLAQSEIEGRDPVADPDHAGRYLVRRLAGRRDEVFGALSVDARHGVLRAHELTRGTRNQAPADPAELFRRCLLDDAAGVIVFHNHPSGALEPSLDDIELTRRLVQAGRVLNVLVHDHLIIAGSRWLSLRRVRPDLFTSVKDGDTAGM